MRTLALLMTFAAAVAFADEETPAPEEKPAPEAQKSDTPSRIIVRGGANMDLNQSINLGGANSSGARVTAGLNGGIGYLVVPPSLSVDLDVQVQAYLTPTPGLSLVELTPGARYYVGNLQFRVGVPIPVYPTFGVGVLGGVAWSQPLGGKARFVAGVDYTYYLTESFRQIAPYGRVDVHAGVQTSF